MGLREGKAEEPIRLKGVFYDNWRAITPELSYFECVFHNIRNIVFLSTENEDFTEYIIRELGFSNDRILGFLESIYIHGRLELEGKSREYIDGVNLSLVSGIRIPKGQ